MSRSGKIKINVRALLVVAVIESDNIIEILKGGPDK